MADRDRFELDLAAALRAYLEEAPTEVRPTELARHFATAYPRGRTTFGPWRLVAVPRRAWVLLLLAGLLAALVGGTLFVGSQLQRRLPAVVPPVLSAYVCPPGSTPDEPGPVDQARPTAYYGWSPKAFDRRAGKLIVLVGGEGVPGTVVETWTFDVCANTWTQMHPNREPPLQVSSLVYDADSDLTIGVHSKDWVYPEVPGSVWAYDLEANTWTELGAARTSAYRFYDPVSGLVFADEWNYDVETDLWTPNPRGGDCHACVYDASVDRAIKYHAEGVPATSLLDIRTGVWSTRDAETPDCSMHAWAYPAIVYDEAARRTVVTGALNMCAYDATADRWEILYERDDGGPLPAPTMYDPVNRRLLVFGYGGGPGTIVSGDIVAFDLVTREWTVLLE